MIRDAWHWIVVEGGVKDVVALVIAWLWVKVIRLSSKVLKLTHILDEIKDLLDTHTDGGLRDVVEAVKEVQQQPGAGGGRVHR